MSSITARDQEFIWHPYTQMKIADPPIAITHGKGSLLFDDLGNRYIDAISSWWVNIHGHAHPYLAQKLFEQALQLEHVIFAGFTHEPAVRLAERLLPLLPGNFSKLFFSDNGSTAVEVALKMCIQFWKNHEGEFSQRKKIIALEGAYHGDTFGAMSVSDRGVFTLPFRDYLFEVEFIPPPTENNIAATLQHLDQLWTSAACFIYEPLVQGAGGMKMYEPENLDILLKAFHAKKIPCIADEVMTGFYRTGKLFAGEYMEEKADIICLSKGITGGMMAMGATACTKSIFDAFLDDDRQKTFFHGHSYTANPLTCAVANASLDLLEEPGFDAKIKWLCDQHSTLKVIQDKHRNFRQRGTIVAFEIEAGTDGYLNNVSKEISRRALEKNLLIRPLGNTVYIMPPYCVTREELNEIYTFLLSL